MTTRAMGKPREKTAAQRNARVAARLEALWERQRRERSPRRTGRLETDALRAKRTEMEAKTTAQRKRLPAHTQARMLAAQVCLVSLHARRRSLRADLQAASTLRMLRDIGATTDHPPARTSQTAKTIRALDRAEALLLRLVLRGAEREQLS